MSQVGIDGVKPKDALGFMQRLSPTVTYVEPSASSIASASSNAAQPDPELILLSTWMGAKESHIAKYVQQYRDIFPTSRILVAQCPFTHVYMPFLAWKQIRPAVPILKEAIQSESKKLTEDDSSSIISENSAPPRVLIHAFSNGGISTTLFLYNALKRSLGGTLVLPRHVFIFDSCPGTFQWRNTARAIMQVLPRWTSPAIHAILFSVWLFYRVVPVLQPRQNVNSRTIRNPRLQKFEARRTYLYGMEDKMIPPAAVEHEAGLAAEAGFHVRLERFEDATHVAIPMLHPDRYWRVVRETWYGEVPAHLTGVVVEGGEASEVKLEIYNGPEIDVEKTRPVDNEQSIREGAGILVDDVRSDEHGAIEAAANTAGETTESAQSAVESLAGDVKDKAKEVIDETQMKAEGIKAEASTAIEQSKASVSQVLGSAVGILQEIELKAAETNPSKQVNAIIEQLEETASTGIEEPLRMIKETRNYVKPSVKAVGKSANDAHNSAKTTLNEVENKTVEADRSKTPETSTALKAALATARLSPVTAATMDAKNSVHEVKADDSKKTDNNKPHKAKTEAEPKVEQHKAEEANETSEVEQPQPQPPVEQTNANKAEKPKSDHPKPKKSKKNKRN